MELSVKVEMELVVRVESKLATADATHTATAQHRPATASRLPNLLRSSLRCGPRPSRAEGATPWASRRKTNRVFRAVVHVRSRRRQHAPGDFRTFARQDIPPKFDLL